jgi:hypothetical protein
MATAPIFPATPKIAFADLSAADTTKTGTTLLALATFGASGSRLRQLRCCPKGTNAAKTVLRLFLNNGGSWASAADNVLFQEFPLPATTLDEDDGMPTLIFDMGDIEVPAAWEASWCLATAVASGWHISLIWSDY